MLCVPLGVSKPTLEFSPAIPPSSSVSPVFAPPVATDDEIKAEIEADVVVVSNLKELEISFMHTYFLSTQRLPHTN